MTTETTDPAEGPLLEAPAADFTPPEDVRDLAGDEYLRESVEAQHLYDRAVEEARRGNENGAVGHFLRASKLAETAREWYLAAAACQRVGDVYSTPGGPYDPNRAVRMYYRAISAYENCGMIAEARELAYRVAFLKLRRGREFGLGTWRRAELFLYWLIAGFGFRPLRVLATGCLIVLGFAITYWLTGGVVTQDGRTVDGFGDAAYFSGITFVTVGFGEFVPAPHARFLALAEGAIGFAGVSFFVVVLTNRLRF